MLDLAPGAVAEIAGARLPARVARAYRRYRHGPGAFKVDLAVEGGVPWSDEAARRAGTRARDRLLRGGRRRRARGQPRPDARARPSSSSASSTSPTRPARRGDVHPVWAYAHVPSGYTGDATEALLDQIERFAPGLRERILARAIRSTAELAAYNANYVGGDIITGANTPLPDRDPPAPGARPLRTGIPGVFICSAATPPGAGAHGMCGYNAARRVLRRLGAQ